MSPHRTSRSLPAATGPVRLASKSPMDNPARPRLDHGSTAHREPCACMANSGSRAPAALRVLTLMILIFLAISQWLGEQARFNGVDFYQLWGVGAAQKLSGHSLGSPYAERERYAVVLNDYAGTVNYPSLTTANAVWKRLALTATPSSTFRSPCCQGTTRWRSACSAVSSSSCSSLAFCILGIQYRYDRFQMACMALLFVLFFGPFRSDLRVGNVQTRSSSSPRCHTRL